ncbi:MAG TPA: hypothetical protein VGL13_01005, partial [Polyangiaceae bacterium]
EGKPVLGLPSNLDQYLAMTAIEQASAGVLVRSDRADAPSLKQAMERLLESPELRAGARAMGETFRNYDCHQRFAQFLEGVLDHPREAIHGK